MGGFVILNITDVSLAQPHDKGTEASAKEHTVKLQLAVCSFSIQWPSICQSLHFRYRENADCLTAVISAWPVTAFRGLLAGSDTCSWCPIVCSQTSANSTFIQHTVAECWLVTSLQTAVIPAGGVQVAGAPVLAVKPQLTARLFRTQWLRVCQ